MIILYIFANLERTIPQMSATPIDPKITEAVVIDWRMGQLSQDDIAEDAVDLRYIDNAMSSVDEVLNG